MKRQERSFSRPPAAPSCGTPVTQTHGGGGAHRQYINIFFFKTSLKISTVTSDMLLIQTEDSLLHATECIKMYI